VFASLAADGPGLLEFLGRSKIASTTFATARPRARSRSCRLLPHDPATPTGRSSSRTSRRADPSVTHQSTGRAARDVELEIEKRTGKIPLPPHALGLLDRHHREVDNFQTLNYPYGHCILTGYMGLRPKDPDTLEYERVLAKAYGEKRRRRSSHQHHTCSSILGLGATPLHSCARAALGRQQDADRNLALPPESAPEPIYRAPSPTYNLVNSPFDADQRRRPGELLEAHQGLSSDGETG